jgi:hypothetical protein
MVRVFGKFTVAAPIKFHAKTKEQRRKEKSGPDFCVFAPLRLGVKFLLRPKKRFCILDSQQATDGYIERASLKSISRRLTRIAQIRKNKYPRSPQLTQYSLF